MRGLLAVVLAVAGAATGAWAATPIAPHLTAVVDKNGEVVIKLAGFDADGDKVRLGAVWRCRPSPEGPVARPARSAPAARPSP